MRAATIALALAFASSCAGERRAPPVASPPPPAAASDDEFAPLTWEERHDVMTFVVLPNMGRTFQRFERKSDPDLRCTTCHGADAEAIGYAMPNRSALAPLDPKDPMAASDPARARVVRFMADEVTPTMEQLLGVPKLTCFACHAEKR